MNRYQRRKSQQAFTLVELFAVLFCIGVVLLWLSLPKRRSYSRINCVNNLKQIGVGYRVWAGDNNNLFPWAVSVKDGGVREYFTNSNQRTNCWRVYTNMAMELGQTPRVVLCPSDQRKLAANLVSHFDNANLSYFAGVGASDDYPQSILGGDRNLAPGFTPGKDYGFSPANNQGNDITIKTNTHVCWSLKMHSQGNAVGAGNILHGDCSVARVSSASFRTNSQPYAAVPSSTAPTNAPLDSFRLVFP